MVPSTLTSVVTRSPRLNPVILYLLNPFLTTTSTSPVNFLDPILPRFLLTDIFLAFLIFHWIFILVPTFALLLDALIVASTLLPVTVLSSGPLSSFDLPDLGTGPKTGLITAPFPFPLLSYTLAFAFPVYPDPKLVTSTERTSPAAPIIRFPAAPIPSSPKISRTGGPKS